MLHADRFLYIQNYIKNINRKRKNKKRPPLNSLLIYCGNKFSQCFVHNRNLKYKTAEWEKERICGVYQCSAVYLISCLIKSKDERVIWRCFFVLKFFIWGQYFWISVALSYFGFLSFNVEKRDLYCICRQSFNVNIKLYVIVVFKWLIVAAWSQIKL